MHCGLLCKLWVAAGRFQARREICETERSVCKLSSEPPKICIAGNLQCESCLERGSSRHSYLWLTNSKTQPGWFSGWSTTWFPITANQLPTINHRQAEQKRKEKGRVESTRGTTPSVLPAVFLIGRSSCQSSSEFFQHSPETRCIGYCTRCRSILTEWPRRSRGYSVRTDQPASTLSDIMHTPLLTGAEVVCTRAPENEKNVGW